MTEPRQTSVQDGASRPVGRGFDFIRMGDVRVQQSGDRVSQRPPMLITLPKGDWTHDEGASPRFIEVNQWRAYKCNRIALVCHASGGITTGDLSPSHSFIRLLGISFWQNLRPLLRWLDSAGRARTDTKEVKRSLVNHGGRVKRTHWLCGRCFQAKPACGTCIGQSA